MQCRLPPPPLEQHSEQKHPPESSPARGCAGTSPPTSKPLEGATALSISHNEHEREESPAACDDSPQRKNDAVRATTAAVVPGLAPEDDHKHWPKASANAGPNLAASPPLFSVDSLAKFTRFLSLLVVASEEERAAFTTERERSALGELLSARREHNSMACVFLFSFFLRREHSSRACLFSVSSFFQRVLAATLGAKRRHLGRSFTCCDLKHAMGTSAAMRYCCSVSRHHIVTARSSVR